MVAILMAPRGTVLRTHFLQLALICLLAPCADSFSSLSMKATPPRHGLAASSSSCPLSQSAAPFIGRAEFLRSAALAGAAVLPLSPASAEGAAEDAAEDAEEFTVAFSCSRGPLGIKVQELRIPKQPSRVVVTAVDPRGQGIKQDPRVRPGLLVTAVQGRSTAGVPAKQVIKELENEIIARIGPEGVAAAVAEGLPEKARLSLPLPRLPISAFRTRPQRGSRRDRSAGDGATTLSGHPRCALQVEMTLSAKCASAPGEPGVCYNSVMSLDSVVGRPRK